MVSFSDDFNRADNTSLGANWVEVSGDWAIVSNYLSAGSAGGTILLRAATAMASNDHYVQVRIASTAAASHGVWCRGTATLTSGYLWRNDGSSWNLFSVTGGSFTSIGTYAGAAVAGDVAKLQTVGTTIKGFVNGIERVSVVNAAVATGTSVGIRSESVAALHYDDFAAADVTAGTTLALTPAGETGTAQTLGRTKTATLLPAASTTTAQPIGGTKTGTLTAAAVQETAQTLTGAKTTALAPSSTAHAAQALTGAKTVPLGIAAATETAPAVTGSKSSTLGVATFVEDVRPLATAKDSVLGGAVEQGEAAQNLVGSKTSTLETASTAEAAQPFTRAKATALVPAIEQHTIQALAGMKTLALNTAESLDAAQMLAPAAPTAALPSAGSSETARPLTGVKTALLAPAMEVCTARPLARQSTVVPSPERTMHIPAENRRLVVAAEDRTLTVRPGMTTDTLNIIKDPEARLPYTWNWTPWLAAEDDTIDSVTILLAAGLTAIEDPVIDGGFVTQRVAGGTVGLFHRMTCRITTTGGLVDDRSIYLTIKDR